jgi:hypothetical protein
VLLGAIVLHGRAEEIAGWSGWDILRSGEMAMNVSYLTFHSCCWISRGTA